jgi:uncharacterized protein (TIGR02271 family)
MVRVTDKSHRWQALAVIDSAGEKVGKVKDVYLDRHSQRPDWVLVSTGLLGGSSFVPLTGAVITEETLQVGFAKEQITSAPDVRDEGELSPDDEAVLYDHYEVAHSARSAPDPEAPSAAVVGVGGHPSDDDAMTRSEEEVTVDTVRRPAEVVRLRKHVVAEEVQVTVTVQREEIRIERIPVGELEQDAAQLESVEWGAGGAEVVLFEEQVIVNKRVVPRERVRVEKEVVTEERVVSADVRKEEIDVDRENLR